MHYIISLISVSFTLEYYGELIFRIKIIKLRVYNIYLVKLQYQCNTLCHITRRELLDIIFGYLFSQTNTNLFTYSNVIGLFDPPFQVFFTCGPIESISLQIMI